METTKSANTLPDTYIPHRSTHDLSTLLERLHINSLYQLCIHWTQSTTTQPFVPQDSIYTQQGLCNKLLKEIKSFRKNAQGKKGGVIRKIIYEYWTNGLNLLQLAQLDCQLIVDASEHFNWNYSTISDLEDKLCCPDIDPQHVTQNVAARLSKLYFTHVYILKHPQLPLHITRVQVFDLNQQEGLLDGEGPQVTSHKPFFFCLLSESSPYLLHSVKGNDILFNLIMQTIEECIHTHNHIPVKLDTPLDQKSIQSLETIYTLKGDSRLGRSLGIWTPYADGVVDLTPFGALDKHHMLQEKSHAKDADHTGDISQIVASLRFKGVVTDNHTSRKRQFEAIEDNTLLNTSELNPGSQFASRTPLQVAEFVIQEPINPGQSNSRSNIKLKFSGSDVFGGLHELSTAITNPNEMVINPTEIPSWLTGEDGATFGHVRNGEFNS